MVLLFAAAAFAGVSQKDNVQISFDGRLAPTKLPRVGLAPVRMSVSGDIGTTDHSQPPALQTVDIAINRHGHVFYKGLPTCPESKLTNTTSTVALQRCRDALIGTGHFRAKVDLPPGRSLSRGGKDPLLQRGNASNGTHVILAHIFGRVPLATTYILPFTIRKARGPKHLRHHAHGHLPRGGRQLGLRHPLRPQPEAQISLQRPPARLPERWLPRPSRLPRARSSTSPGRPMSSGVGLASSAP